MFYFAYYRPWVILNIQNSGFSAHFNDLIYIVRVYIAIICSNKDIATGTPIFISCLKDLKDFFLLFLFLFLLFLFLDKQTRFPLDIPVSQVRTQRQLQALANSVVPGKPPSMMGVRWETSEKRVAVSLSRSQWTPQETLSLCLQTSQVAANQCVEDLSHPAKALVQYLSLFRIRFCILTDEVLISLLFLFVKGAYEDSSPSHCSTSYTTSQCFVYLILYFWLLIRYILEQPQFAYIIKIHLTYTLVIQIMCFKWHIPD